MPRKAELPSYVQIRDELVRAHPNAPPSPCLKGKAECCDRSVGLSRADASLLLQAFARGQIPDTVRERAYRNVLDRHRDRCPFLGVERECMIYPFRPLICLAWGIGGRPRPEVAAELSQRKRIQDRTGVEQSVRLDEILCYACPSCLEELQSQGPEYPLTLIEAITTAYLYIHTDDESGSHLINFVKKNLRRPIQS